MSRRARPSNGAPQPHPYGFTVLRHRTLKLVKAWTENPDGSISIDPYPRAKNLVAEARKFTDIRDLHRQLVDLEPQDDACIIRALPRAESYGTNRRRLTADDYTEDGELIPATYDDVSLAWGMLDADKVPLPAELCFEDDPELCIRWLIRKIDRYIPGLAKATVHVQLSSSAGREILEDERARTISAHIFVLFEKAYP